MARALLLALVTACWTGPAPAPPPAAPEPTVAARPVEPQRWRASPQRPERPKPPPRGPMDVARELASQLRSGSHVVSAFVAGPVVVLDLDNGTISTVCDTTAVSGAQTWGQLLSDPSRTAPTCRPGTSFTCSQFAQSQMLVIELADPDQWRIVSVMIGNYRTGRTTLSSKMSQLRAQVATATCP